MNSISRQEEVIATLWIMAAILAFTGGYAVWGWIFTVKAVIDIFCAFYFGIKEVISELDAGEDSDAK